MKWVGCYQHSGERELAYQNTLSRPYGYTSTACSRACHGFRYVLLKDDGHCTCLAIRPREPEFTEVSHEQCGSVCSTEEALLPKRFCGSKTSFAIFRFESAAEVFEELEEAGPHDSKIGEDIWKSWPELRKGTVMEIPSAHSHAHSHHGVHAPVLKNKKQILKGISYGPVPLREHGRLPDDDFMSATTKPLWGSDGRGDLAIIRALGANTVRLYGNDPALDHTAFLDEALLQGLQVIAGLSDYPYTQMPDNCASTEFNCYHQVKSQYKENLRRGFLTVGNAYHPALRTVILMNEPDLKFHGGPKSYCKALISAFDAALDAEKEMGVAGQAPAFTATFSFGVCPACKDLGWKPAIGQMLELRKAMMHPESVGYHTRNDIWAAYQARFINSANTANPATDIPRLFLNSYDEHFPRVPVFIGEYHSPRTVDQKRDLETILSIARNESTMLEGISFFEYQVRYDKGGSEESFGMFGLEDRSVMDMRIGNGAFSVWCLKPLEAATIAGRSYHNDCGPIEVGVDYVSESAWALSMDHIPSPAFCCQQCQENTKCLSWTWVEDAGLESPGLPSQCWLKGGLPSGKVPKDGVISGIPKGIGGHTGAPRKLRHRDHTAQQVSAEARRKYEEAAALAAEADGEQMQFGQCGGEFWEGPMLCPRGFRCRRRTELYSQCLPEEGSDAASSNVAGTSEEDPVPNIFVHMAVAAAFGGPGVSAKQLCPIPETVTSTSTLPIKDDKATEWFGCFLHSEKSSYVYSNEQGGYTSNSCARACEGYKYSLLHNAGHCSCASTEPEESHFTEVLASQCETVCVGEEMLVPLRYCGGADTFAIYRLKGQSGSRSNDAEARDETDDADATDGSTPTAEDRDSNLFVPYDSNKFT